MDCTWRWTICLHFLPLSGNLNQNIPDTSAAILCIWNQSLHSGDRGLEPRPPSRSQPELGISPCFNSIKFINKTKLKILSSLPKNQRLESKKSFDCKWCKTLTKNLLALELPEPTSLHEWADHRVYNGPEWEAGLLKKWPDLLIQAMWARLKL